MSAAWQPGLYLLNGYGEEWEERSSSSLFFCRKGVLLRYLPQQLDNQPTFSSISGTSLRSFIERTTVYEDMPVPFDVRLRRATWTGIVLTLVSLIVTRLLPAQEAVRGAFFLVLADQLRSYIGYIVRSPWILGVDCVLLVAALVLFVQTRNLRLGKLLYHWLAFVQALAGGVNLLMLAIPLFLVMLNLMLWIIIVVLGIVGILIGVAMLVGIGYVAYLLVRFLITLVYWLVVIAFLTIGVIAVIFVVLVLLRMVVVH
jgi:hypothetical protein